MSLINNNQIEKQLAETTNQLNLVLQAAKIGTWTWNLEDGSIVWDELCHEIFGIKYGDFKGTFEAFAEFIYSEDIPEIQRRVERALLFGEPYTLNYRIYKPSGETAYLNAQAIVYHDAENTPIRVIGIVWDVTQEKLYEAELLKAQQFRHALLNSSEYMIISTTKDGVITYFNSMAEKLLGYSAEEMIGKQTPGIFHDASEIANYAQELNQTYGWNLQPGFDVFVAKINYLDKTDMREWTYITKSGKRFPVLLMASALRDSENQIIGYLGFVRDVSLDKLRENELERKTLELKRSNMELEQFAYITSHDLKEPLRVISSYSKLLEKKLAKYNINDKSISEYVSYITSSIARMQVMINDILTYSRVGRKTVYEHIKLDEILKNVLIDLSSSIIEKDVLVNFDQLPEMILCETEIKQVFQNLISNALKFTRSDVEAVINISCRQLSDDEWQFSISDNGIGIEHEFFERIFVIFQRLHTREEFEGTGIGLALCKKIVENHDGRIWLESVFGSGTTFHFTLKNMQPTII